MPKIEKQYPAAANSSSKPKTTTAPATPTEDAQGLKALFFGESGTGKTRLACTFAKPMLLIGTQDGTRSVATGKRKKGILKPIEVLGTVCEVVLYELLLAGKPTGIDFCRIAGSQNFDELTPLTKERYKSVALDYGGGLQDMMVMEFCNLTTEQMLNMTYGTVDRKDWGLINSQWESRITGLFDLADQFGHNVAILTHERTFGNKKESEIISPRTGAELTPAASKWLHAEVDYSCQTFIRQKLVESTAEGTDVPVFTATKDVEFCLRVRPSSVYNTKFRTVGDLLPDPIELPEAIVNPTYDKIVRLIRGERV
jgi:AAA domain